MSRRVAQTAVWKAWLSLVAMISLPALVSGANANTRKDPNQPAVKKEDPGRITPQSQQSRPVSAQKAAARRPPVRTPASFTPQMPLSEAIEILRDCTTPPLNIIVLWRDLEAAGIYHDTPIGIDGLPGLRVRQYLDMLVLSLSAGADSQISYSVQQGVITVATTIALPAPKPVTRVYDVRDLVAPPSNPAFSGMGFGGMGLGSYGGQMMGAGGYGGMGSGYMSGGSYGLSGTRALSGAVGNSYSGARIRSGVIRVR